MKSESLKRKRLLLNPNWKMNKKQSETFKNSNSSSETMGSTNAYSAKLARSESECNYSPQKRNTFKMLRKRGVPSTLSSRRNYRQQK